ncbi:MAG: hypothetical protein O2807_13760 [bacterium]|nr:hypothetical protein [bacterium]
MNIYTKWIARFRHLPVPLLYLHVAAKFLFGVGLGMLIVAYSGGDWVAAGWWVIAAALIVGIPSSIKILKP